MHQAFFPSPQPQLGFLGGGPLGQAIARNLLRAGYALRAYDETPQQNADLASQDLRVVQVYTPAEAVIPGGIVISMVPDDAALRRMVLGEQGILAHLGTGGIHLSLSTISPHLAEQLAAAYADRGAHFLCANVFGRPDVAVATRLSIHLAGNSGAKAQVRTLLEVIGTHIYDLGERASSANVVTLAANYVILSALVTMAEAASLVEHAGIDRVVFLRALAESPLFGCTVYREYGAAMIGHRDYQPALFDIKQGLKEVNLLMEEAEQSASKLVMTAPVQQALQAALDAGRGHEDWSVLAEFCVQSESNRAVCLSHPGTPSPPPAMKTRGTCTTFDGSLALNEYAAESLIC